MLEIERKLGRYLSGRTTKAASLLRITDYLISRDILVAVPEQDTEIIRSRPTEGRFRSALVATAFLLSLVIAGAALYSHQVRAGKEPIPQHTIVPAQQSMATA